jgi:hypothetical protein
MRSQHHSFRRVKGCPYIDRLFDALLEVVVKALQSWLSRKGAGG